MTVLRSAPRLLGSLLGFLFALVCLSPAQDPDDPKPTVFGSMTVDAAGHVCYTEPIPGGNLDRLEFRTDGKDVLYLFQTVHGSSKVLEVTDLDLDHRPDLIHIEWTGSDGITNKASFYRGPGYREHLRQHLLHALASTRRHLIKDRPEEQQRALLIEERLKRLESGSIKPGEIGVYDENATFQPSGHKDLRYAFIASDTLTTALRRLIDGDVRVLSRPPDIVPTYRIDLDILLAIDPGVDRRR